MKSLTLTLAVLLGSSIANTALAQSYACQHLQTVGMAREQSSWESSEFKNGEPFFLVLNGSTISPDSAHRAFGARMITPGITCAAGDKGDPKYGDIHICHDDSYFLTFSTGTLSGGVAKLFGAIQAANDPPFDTITMSRFSCQQIK